MHTGENLLKGNRELREHTLKQPPYTHVADPETIQLLPVQLSLKSAKQPHSPAKKKKPP